MEVFALRPQINTTEGERVDKSLQGSGNSAALCTQGVNGKPAAGGVFKKHLILYLQAVLGVLKVKTEGGPGADTAADGSNSC